jgi:hypothetical protein
MRKTDVEKDTKANAFIAKKKVGLDWYVQRKENGIRGSDTH